MAKVRALEPCYYERQYRVIGAEFDYHGPQQGYLQLVEGKWESKPKPAAPITSEQALQMENDMLRKQLAELQAQGKPARVPLKNVGRVPPMGDARSVQVEIGESVDPADTEPDGEAEGAAQDAGDMTDEEALAAANEPVKSPSRSKAKPKRKKTAEPAGV